MNNSLERENFLLGMIYEKNNIIISLQQEIEKLKKQIEEQERKDV